MIDVTIKMSVPADKRDEILYTIKDLIVNIRLVQECVSCLYSLDVEE